MAEISLTIEIDAATALRTTGRVARERGYTVLYQGDNELSLRKGSVVGNLVAGALLTYRDFSVTLRENPDRSTTIVVAITKHWWTGKLGRWRVSTQARELLSSLEEAFREDGAKIIGREVG